MPPLFTRHLADGLAASCALPVPGARHGVPLEPGHVWIAPGDRHLVVGRGAPPAVPDGARIPADLSTPTPRLWLSDAPPENGCRPSVNPLFRSAAESFGRGVLAVVLTGMGQDG